MCCAVLSCSVVSEHNYIPCTVARQAPLSTGFSRQEYWNVFPYPPPGDLPNPGIEPRSPTLQVDSSLSKPPYKIRVFKYKMAYFKKSNFLMYPLIKQRIFLIKLYKNSSAKIQVNFCKWTSSVKWWSQHFSTIKLSW